jgi:hypothetical protein
MITLTKEVYDFKLFYEFFKNDKTIPFAEKQEVYDALKNKTNELIKVINQLQELLPKAIDPKVLDMLKEIETGVTPPEAEIIQPILNTFTEEALISSPPTQTAEIAQAALEEGLQIAEAGTASTIFIGTTLSIVGTFLFIFGKEAIAYIISSL